MYAESLHELTRRADVVSLHVPLTTETHHLVGPREFSLMKEGSILVNTSRGAVVDENALVAALRHGPLGVAGLDVFENEPFLSEGLARLDNVVLAPHMGSATHEARGRMAEMAVQNALRVVRGETVPHAVNAVNIH